MKYQFTCPRGVSDDSAKNRHWGTIALSPPQLYVAPMIGEGVRKWKEPENYINEHVRTPGECYVKNSEPLQNSKKIY